MDFEGVLSIVTYVVFLVCIPLAAVMTYFVLLLHQSIRNQERYGELWKRKGRRKAFLKKTAEAKRLADPFFHFNINKSKGVEELVEEQLQKERGTKPRSRTDMSVVVSQVDEQKDSKIAKAIEEGRLILLETEIDRCGPGMVIGRSIENYGLARGDEISADALRQLRESGITSLPVLYNPGRVAGAMATA